MSGESLEQKLREQGIDVWNWKINKGYITFFTNHGILLKEQLQRICLLPGFSFLEWSGGDQTFNLIFYSE